MKSLSYIISFVMVLFLWACGGNERKYIPPPTNEMITKLMSAPSYTIVLADMDMDESEETFKHKYQVIYPVDSVLKDSITQWYAVDEAYFWKNEDNLGMALVTKSEDGTLNKIASPPGYDNYVGNEKYGSWNSGSTGSSFWVFYGQYAMMSTLFGMNRSPVSYDNHRRYSSTYKGSRPYYGASNTNPTYGTKSAAMRKSNPTFFSRRASKTGWNASSRTYNTTGKTSGSGTSRFSSTKSSRGFGGGFGK